MESLKKYNKILEEGLKKVSFGDKPDSLYDPVKYILGIGGKRVRPVLTLMSCSSFNCNPILALEASLSVELFHNFTLIHDDIMDSAHTRRGKETVHKKWGLNSGVLSGDVMLIMAYQLLENYDSETFFELNQLLNKTAKQVCEGQQMDMDFELKSDVVFDEYIQMIKFKTAVLLGCALKMGAVVANASKKDQENLYQYGINLGLAFQFQDDYLDTFGNESKVGKKIGGDILENKKTVLFHMAIQNSNDFQKNHILDLYNSNTVFNNKIKQVTSLFKETKADIDSLELVDQYTKKAIQYINMLSISEDKKNEFILFSKELMERDL
ncbi:polyprenyl synthetase family protein [Flavobacteriaceae bacterium]|jgi:geranylgeranyl diphosphate synthase type II|nr:polyprenyl synthetase family protein [Flavobacteriaceae bacterium]